MKAPWPLLGTPDGTIPNEPCELGTQLGDGLARFCETEITNGAIDKRCHDCAFRRGTRANQTMSTADALKCLLERTPFHCHVDDGEPVCGGFAMLIRSVKQESQQDVGSV